MACDGRSHVLLFSLCSAPFLDGVSDRRLADKARALSRKGGCAVRSLH